MDNNVYNLRLFSNKQYCIALIDGEYVLWNAVGRRLTPNFTKKGLTRFKIRIGNIQRTLKAEYAYDTARGLIDFDADKIFGMEEE